MGNWQTTIPGSGGGTPPTTSKTGNAWSVLSGLVGIGSNAIQNKQAKKREAEKRAYDLEQWNRKNKYNHPLTQMQRLTEAGLNPNLIYGSSPGSAVGNADSVHAGKAPEYKLDNPVTGFMNTRVQQAQTNNLKSASNLNIVKSMEGIARTDLTNVQKQNQTNLLAGNLELQQQEIKKNTATAVQEILKAKAMLSEKKGLIARYAAETQTAFENRDIAKLKKDLDKLNSENAKAGLRPSDPLWIRIFSQIFGVEINSPKNLNTIIDSLENNK